MVDYADIWFEKAEKLTDQTTDDGQSQADVFFETAEEKIVTASSLPWEGRTSPVDRTVPEQLDPLPTPSGGTVTDIKPEPVSQSVLEPGPFTEPEVPRKGVIPGGRDYSLGPYGEVITEPGQFERRPTEEETISPESEKIRLEDIRRGEIQIEGATKQAREFSYNIFGDPEATGSDEALPKIISAGAEWIITLPAETVKSGVSLHRMGTEILNVGPGQFFKEQAKYIAKDPYARGTGLVLSAALIGAPVGKAAFTRFRGSRAVDTVTAVPEPPVTSRGGYMVYETEAAFLKEGSKITGKAVTKVKYPGSQETATITTETVTLPRNDLFVTTGESRIAMRSKLDLTTATREADVTISKTRGEMDLSRFASRQVTDTGQLNIMGESAPTIKDISGARISKSIDKFTDVSIGVTKGDIPSIEFGRTTLLEGAKSGKVTFRRTQTIEGYMERDAFLKLIEKQEGPQDLQTLRGFEPGAGKYTGPKDPGISAAERSIVANVKSFVDMKVPGPKPSKISAPTRADVSVTPAAARPSRSVVPGVGEVVPVETLKGPPGRFEGIQSPFSGRRSAEPGLIDVQALKIDSLSEIGLQDAQKTQGLGEMSGLKPQIAHYTGQEFIQDAAQSQGQVQKQLQISAIGTDTMLSQDTRLSLNIKPPGPTPPRPRPYGESWKPRPRGMPPFLPLIPPGAPTSGAPAPPIKKKRRGLGLKTYAPSLTGIVSGAMIS